MRQSALPETTRRLVDAAVSPVRQVEAMTCKTPGVRFVFLNGHEIELNAAETRQLRSAGAESPEAAWLLEDDEVEFSTAARGGAGALPAPVAQKVLEAIGRVPRRSEKLEELAAEIRTEYVMDDPRGTDVGH